MSVITLQQIRALAQDLDRDNQWCIITEAIPYDMIAHAKNVSGMKGMTFPDNATCIQVESPFGWVIIVYFSKALLDKEEFVALLSQSLYVDLDDHSKLAPLADCKLLIAMPSKTFVELADIRKWYVGFVAQDVPDQSDATVH